MRPAIWKITFREIKRTLGRYLTILAIVALGIGFFVGLKITRSVMIASVSEYAEEQNFYDYEMLSTLGFTEEDVEAFSELSDVRKAAGVINLDVLYVSGEDELAISIYSISDGVNDSYLVAGRMPEAANECVVDVRLMSEEDIGTMIEIASDNDEDTLDMLVYDSYEVVGIIENPLYLNFERGTTSLGSGKISGYVFIPEEGFDSDYYTAIYIKYDQDYEFYSDEYEDYIEAHEDEVDALLSERVQLRYDTLIADGEEEIAEAESEIADAEAEIADAETELAERKAEVEAELADAHTQITESEAEIEDGWAEIEENQQKLADAKQEIEDGEAELTDAKQEVEDGKAEIEDVRQELADLEATQYLLGRDSNVGYVCFESDSMIVDNIANIFPFFFFLVAILICITTMNRMVEEGRTQIGVLKALGYSKSAIAGEYLVYSGSAALIGGLIGFAVGSTLFPSIIWYVYGIMYDAPGTRLVFSSGWLLFSILVALICSVGATLFSCYVEFASVPANLMRPRTPQSGKRVFMEYVTPVWKRLNFLQKVSVRNVLRYKKRFLMMVLGVSGCTALLLAANGMKDSVLHIADSQYDNIQTYDMEVTLSDGADEGQRTRLCEDYAEDIADMMFLHEDSVDLVTDDLTKEATLVVAQDPSQMEEFWHLYDSKGNAIDYPGEGEAVLTKKIANKLGVSVGDTLTVRTDDMKTYTVTVTGIAVNYVYNYMYISEDTYVQGYGTDPEYKMVCMKVAEGVDVYEASTVIVDDDDVLLVTITEDVRTRLENMMDSLDAVVVLVITCAALLAFIVLYNLTNINIIERVREIATIKVLGFYPGETAQYVFRENLILTAIGAVIGLLLGKWLHAFIMVNIDVDIVSFELLIYPKSYILSIVLTFVFALLVDLVMYFKLQKIDMAESLKSIE